MSAVCVPTAVCASNVTLASTTADITMLHLLSICVVYSECNLSLVDNKYLFEHIFTLFYPLKSAGSITLVKLNFRIEYFGATEQPNNTIVVTNNVISMSICAGCSDAAKHMPVVVNLKVRT